MIQNSILLPTKTCAFNTESMKKVFNVFPRKFVYTYCTQ